MLPIVDQENGTEKRSSCRGTVSALAILAPTFHQTESCFVHRFTPHMDFGVGSSTEKAVIIGLSDLFALRRQLTMNRLALGFSLSLFLFFNLSINAQENRTSGDDASAVRATVTNYIEAYYTGDAARMEQTLHSHYLKHKIHGDIPMREQTGRELVQAVRSGEGTRMAQAQRTEKVTVLDVAGNIASAKLVTPGWVDYMTLSKINGEWKILSVVQRIDD